MNHSRSILRTSPICFGATKNFTVLLSSVSGVLRIRSTNALEDCSYTATTSVNVAGALGILPNSIPPSNACSLAFCSVTNIHASSLADLRSEEQRLNSSHSQISYAVFCLKKKNSSSYGIRLVRYRGQQK